MITFSVKLPFEVEYEHLIGCRDANQAEKWLHKIFESKRINGEWFTLTDEDVSWIKSFDRIDMDNLPS